jgi:hypothetical protein
MLRNQFFFLGAAAVLVGVTGLAACGGGTTTPGGGGSGGGSSGGPGLKPPSPTAGAPAGDGTGKTFAVNKLYLGLVKRDGSASTEAWKDFGYDIDGKVSDINSAAQNCKPLENGAPDKVHTDGNNGIDNAFGKNILPIIKGLAPDAEALVNEQIQEGSFSILIDIENLGDAADYSALSAKLYIASDEGEEPGSTALDGTWDLFSEFLNNGDPEDPKVKFADAYLTADTFVSGTPGQLDLSLSVAGFSLALNISSAVITMDLDGAHGSATNGVISGVIPTESLVSELVKVAGAFDEQFCNTNNSTLQSGADADPPGLRHLAERHARPLEELRRHLDRPRLRHGRGQHRQRAPRGSSLG